MIASKTALAAILLLGGATAGGVAYYASTGKPAVVKHGPRLIPLTIRSANGEHGFTIERATTADEQERGLMYRTDLKPDGGMLFWPYPAAGGGPKVANFWMKNTPSPLDIIFIRADRTIARIAENTVPFSETMVPSGEPVGAVLEIPGGRAADLGISEGDSVSWSAK